MYKDGRSEAEITLSIRTVSDGYSWDIVLKSDGEHPDRHFYGSQRTKTARGVDPRAAYDALHATVRELLSQGELMWLF